MADNNKFDFDLDDSDEDFAPTTPEQKAEILLPDSLESEIKTKELETDISELKIASPEAETKAGGNQLSPNEQNRNRDETASSEGGGSETFEFLQMDPVNNSVADELKNQLTWNEELEIIAGTASANYADIRRVAANRSFPQNLRPKLWQVLLGVAAKSDQFTEFDDLYNLPEQAAIRQACKKLIDRLGNPAEDRMSLKSDLESVLTLFCKSRQLQFNVDNGWMDILQLLMVLNLPRAQLYNVFSAFTTKYIARGCVANGRPFDLFRLLLLYHDPQLCSFLDTRKITPDLYATEWFTCLFAATASLDVVLRIWDVYLQHADPFLLFFMALVMLLNAKLVTLSCCSLWHSLCYSMPS